MKWILTEIIFVLIIGATVLNGYILRVSKSGFGFNFNVNNPGEFFKTFTQMSDNCTADSKTVLIFDIDTGPRKWSFVEFTSPMNIKLSDQRLPGTYTNDTVIQSRIGVAYEGRCQIDAQVYLRPENIL